LDYIPGREEYMAAMAARREYDYIIGSVHFINGWGFDHPDFKSGFEHRDIDEIYQDYAALLIKMADSRLFDVVGHIDLVKVWGHRPSKRSALHYLQPVLESIKNSGMAVEINSAGLRKPVAELYPAADVLQTMFDLNVPIIFGSDAHHPDQVGAGLPEACEAARKAGYRYLVRLSRRQRIITPF
jgi:histidinol-phosphatase (PHP family)